MDTILLHERLGSIQKHIQQLSWQVLSISFLYFEERLSLFLESIESLLYYIFEVLFLIFDLSYILIFIFKIKLEFFFQSLLCIINIRNNLIPVKTVLGINK